LGVETVLDGSIQRQGDRLRVTVQLISVKDGSQLWGKTFDEKFTDIFAVQDAISEKVTEALALKLSGEEQTGLAKRYTENAEAYQLYLLGRFYWNKRSEEGIKKAIAYFDQAIEKDPNYALAYAGLSQCYIVLDAYYLLPPQEAIPKAKAAATRALEIDDTLAEAYAALATYYYDWDWPAAERQFKRAIELNPNYATAHQWYAEFLVNQGRFDEGIAEIKRARELDPLSLIINTVLGRSLYQARQYDQGIEQLRNTIEMDPNFVPAHRHLGQAYEAKGMYSEAVAEMQKAVTLSGSTPEYMAVLGQAYALSGKRAEAMKIVEELKEQSKQRYISACGIALIYAGLGEKDRAFEWLEKAYQEHDYGLIYIRVAPGLESLRSDPRFADLVRRVGLPQ